MSPHHHFKFARVAALLGVIALTFPLTAFCMIAGRADFVVGKVEAVTTDGTRRALLKGSEINAGETINTDVNARAQIRFIDGGFISLQPNTIFRVDEFNYQNKTDGGERSFFSLLKGGLRAITGAIGRTNRDTYRVTTPVATIGIRGTGYNAMLSDGLFVNVGEGAISLTNNAGLLLVSAGGAAFVANINTPPAPTAEQPQMPPASLYSIPDDLTYIVGNDRDPGGSLSILPHLVSGSGYSMSYAYTQCGDGCFGSGSGGLTNVTASFSDISQLQEYQAGTEIGKPSAATAVYAVTDGIIGWGRWNGSTVTVGSIPSLNPGVFDYVIGIPTATMPTSGTATYALLGGTTPTSTDGTKGWVISGTLSTSFSATPTIGVNLIVANPSLSTPVSYNIAGSLIGSGATFSTGTTPLVITSPSLTSCAQGCSASINGFFAGDNAARAGLTYNITESGVRNVAGAAAFTSNGITPPLALSPGL